MIENYVCKKNGRFYFIDGEANASRKICGTNIRSSFNSVICRVGGLEHLHEFCIISGAQALGHSIWRFPGNNISFPATMEELMLLQIEYPNIKYIPDEVRSFFGIPGHFIGR